jgi:hypothetical protein
MENFFDSNKNGNGGKSPKKISRKKNLLKEKTLFEESLGMALGNLEDEVVTIETIKSSKRLEEYLHSSKWIIQKVEGRG